MGGMQGFGHVRPLTAEPAFAEPWEGKAFALGLHQVHGASHGAGGPYRLLLDCGLFQGRRDEARQRNAHFPFDARSIDLVVLSHAHLDHCGNLPSLVRGGFAGPIYCTPATRDLAAVMLADSAKIQEEDADFLNRHRAAGEPPVEPLYRREDARRCAGLMTRMRIPRLHERVEQLTRSNNGLAKERCESCEQEGVGG